LSLSWYVPKTAGIKFLLSKKHWLKKNIKPASEGWQDNQIIFKDYMLIVFFEKRNRTAKKFADRIFSIYIQADFSEAKRQQVVNQKVRAFLVERAADTLVPLTHELAEQGGFKLKSVKIKNLKSRWGSCSHEKVITLSAALMLVPDE